MKHILILRHAKSDWSTGESDFERPLNKRGKTAAPLIGSEIFQRQVIPNLIISSPAKRAKQTAKLVAGSCSFESEIIYNERFYFGNEYDALKAIQNTDNQINRILIVGHNPTWENLATMLINKSKQITMPTAALVSIFVDVDYWEDVCFDTGKLDFLIIPKEL